MTTRRSHGKPFRVLTPASRRKRHGRSHSKSRSRSRSHSRGHR
jgi:hypothetical protein